MQRKAEQYEQLSAYLDGELTPAEVRKVEELLASDPALSAEMEALRGVRQMLRELPRTRASDDFVSRVLEQAERNRLVHQPVAAKPRGQHWVRYFAAAAVFVLAVGVGAVLVYTFSRGVGPQAGHVADKTAAKSQPPAAAAPGETLAPAKGGDEVALADDKRKADTESKSGLPDVSGTEEMKTAPPAAGEVAAAAAPSAKPLGKGGEYLARGGEPPINKSGGGYVGKGGATEAHGKGGWKDTGVVASNASNTGWGGAGFAASNTMNAAPPVAEPIDNDAEVLFIGATNEEIETDNLPAARREVEQVLTRNGVAVMDYNWKVTAENFIPTQELANMSQINRDTPQQVQIVAFVPREQLPQVQRELRQLRVGQDVTRRMPAKDASSGAAPRAEMLAKAQAAPSPASPPEYVAKGMQQSPPPAATTPPTPAETPAGKHSAPITPLPKLEAAPQPAPAPAPEPAVHAEVPNAAAASGQQAVSQAIKPPVESTPVVPPRPFEQPQTEPATPSTQSAEQVAEVKEAATSQQGVQQPSFNYGSAQLARAQQAGSQFNAPQSQAAGGAFQQDRLLRQRLVQRQMNDQLASYDVKPLLITLNLRQGQQASDLQRLNVQAEAASQSAQPAANQAPAEKQK